MSIEGLNEEEKEIERLADEEYFEAYSERTRYFLFFILFGGNVLINIDHGALPGGKDGIEASTSINDWSFGVLGSVVYAGLTVGSLAATSILAHGPAVKPALAITLILNAGCLAAFSLSTTFAVLAFLRGLIGLFQVFCTIYMPVWADAFGKGETQKSIWVTGGLLASPLGVVFGYCLTYSIS